MRLLKKIYCEIWWYHNNTLHKKEPHINGHFVIFLSQAMYYIIYLYFRIHIEQKRMCNFGDTNFVNCIKMMASVVLVDMVKATLARTRLTSLLSFLTVTGSL